MAAAGNPAEEPPKPYQEVIVRYGDLWARIGPNFIVLGYGGGELATFPDFEVFRQFFEQLQKAWSYLHAPAKAPPSQPRPQQEQQLKVPEQIQKKPQERAGP